ncbi:ATP-dependent DNA helicase pif1-like [Teleopsis dalmanni]|uniref:ATP-dependent DNA helicase pif1-like n=1 Tax=Teleopsis dalmanni TaxID=139649 RepID=UPI0018CF2A20|nr:ATP-dependent DNA helicase pif1-like [Teleopsis dalmanni]
MAKVLQKCHIIVWDECTMAHKYSLEALNRTLKDLNANDRLFGGALILLAGDFRQTLPVIPRSTYADEVNACLKSYILWRNVHILRLTEIMRVGLQRDLAAELFAKQLMDIGNGNNHQWLQSRAILAAKNLDVDEINSKIQAMLPGNLISLKSIDTVVDENEIVNYPTDFLNSLDLPELPPHNLVLKVGSPIILLHNLNPPKLSFAMTINKSQCQTLKVCGLNLENTCFSHGQLYVACSRIGKPSDLYMYIRSKWLNKKYCS